MKYETFVEKFNELSTSEKVAIFNDYCLEYGDSDNMLNSFDEEFFELAFSNPMEAARATFFGNIQNWSDEYIRLDGYGNLESVSEYDVDEEIEGYIGEIFEHEKTWENYIEDDDEEDVLNDMIGCRYGEDQKGRDIYDLSDEEWDDLYKSIPWEKAIVVYITT